jgi:prolyl 4-hydroxylase
VVGTCAIGYLAKRLTHTFLWEWMICDGTPDIGIKEIPNILSSKECDALIHWLQTHPERKTISGVDSGVLIPQGIVQYQHRKSEQAWMFSKDHPLVAKIRKAVKPYLQTPCRYQALQIAHYKTGGYFKPHYDNIITPWISKQRSATLIIYLNDDYDGGETRFPYLNRTIRPKKGDAVYFRNLHPINKKVLWHSKHEGCEVKSGEKYIATLWLHEKNERVNKKSL